jgi:phospholipase C
MPPIKHVFVLMLENRSFDHLLGMSPFTGIDAVTQRPTQINALPAGVSNSWNGANYPAGPPAVDPIKNDPYHEFEDVLEQLCGAAVKYPKGGPYPAIDNSGFVSNFAVAAKSPSPGDVMKCFTPERLPVLSALARTYAVCDSWFCSLPGPTWPNRFFALGASSGDLDHSPTTPETEVWETVDGFQFQNGSIFDVKGLSWRIYAGNKIFTLAHGLKGIHIWDIRRYAKFAKDISDPSYPAQFTWIEPNYGHVTTDYLKGNSQHPLDGVTGGEALIKATYQAIRNSPLWESSMFIITWDEHGGFYDHVAPAGGAVEPGDQPAFPGANRYGFRFDQYGPRVPAVVISPLIPANTIDHRPYDHSSILATVERMFKLNPLTRRDRAALDPSGLASLAVPRDVPNVFGEVPLEALAAHQQVRLDGLQDEMPAATQPEAPVDEQPNLPGFIFVASQTDKELQLTEVARELHHAAVRERVARIRTKGDARDYFEEVRRRAVAAEPEL